MAQKAKPAYRVDAEKMVVVINDEVKLKAADTADIRLYLASGYKIRHKSEAKAAIARERANDGLTKEGMIEALAKDKTALNQFNTILQGEGKGSGYFAAKSFFKKWQAEQSSK